MLNIAIGFCLGLILYGMPVLAQWQPGTPKNYERMDQQENRLDSDDEADKQDRFRKQHQPC